jgi:perosamine synthetase
MKKFYPVAAPILNGNERKYILDCIDSNWISSNGFYVNKFEEDFAKYTNTNHAISCSNGTTALHLALLAHGVGKDDEVIIPSLTFVATANAVTYCKAKPVFIDSEPKTWNMDPDLIEAKITPRTKGIIAVHLYGHPANMEPIMKIAKQYGLFVIEDAAEALGAQYMGKMVGSLGDSAIFSFFGNKIITTGEGGMITTNDNRIAERTRVLRGQGMDSNRRYWFPEIGYNYRMTNIQAAIGCGQLEKADWHIQQRIRVAMSYYRYLDDFDKVTLPVQKVGTKNVYWMFSVVMKECTEEMRDKVMGKLRERGIETRPFFYPMHVLPPYKNLQPLNEFPVAGRVSAQGINVPSYGELTEQDIAFISTNLREVLLDIQP